MGETKLPGPPRLPSGNITPLSLLAAAIYLFHLSTGKDLETWLRIILVGMACISIILCLIVFGGKLPCKKRIKNNSTSKLSICHRDFGFLVGILATFLCIKFINASTWKLLSINWHDLGGIRWFIAFSLALPTVVQGTLRRLTNVQLDKGNDNTRILLFVFGFLNALIALALFLEIRP